MILRKPYKFLIKHFKLIHLILTLLMVYVVYKFNYIFSFFNTTVENYVGIITTDATGSLYNIYIFSNYVNYNCFFSVDWVIIF